jgi:enamine deaminase RidA (YjgF/YER057c/UK114 family)
MDIVRKSGGPFRSTAVAAGGFVHVSGQVADCHSRDVKVQTEEVLAKIDAILSEMGTDRSRIVSAQIWLADIDDYARMNEVWDAWVAPDHAPARATVEARLAGPQYRIEIAVIALAK